MKPVVTLGFGLFGLLLGLIGCSSNESVDSVDVDGAVWAMLRGTVTRQDGSPVPGTEVAGVVFNQQSACSGRPVAPVGAQVQANGTFGPTRIGLSLAAPFERCLEVSADPPDSTGLQADTISGVLLDFRDTGALDTAVVNFVLEPK